MMRNVSTSAFICISCKTSVITRNQCGLHLGTTELGLLENVVCDYCRCSSIQCPSILSLAALYCEKEPCFVAVQNGMKNDMADAKAHVQANSSTVPFTSALTCYNPTCAIMQSADMPFKNCSGCLSVKYCSV